MKDKPWLAGLLWLGALVCLLCIDRSDFYVLWPVYTIAFAAYIWLIFKSKTLTLSYGLILGICIRLISYCFEPLLSEDYFRFIWDGMLWDEGIHPMSYTPAWLTQHPEIMETPISLYNKLNSQNYYSVYPPVLQFIFAISYKLNGLHIPEHIFFYKSILFCSDILITFLLYKLLQHKNLPTKRILLFTLNPLIILEFTGNLHMDGIMIIGLLGAILLSEKNKTVTGSLLMAFSILSKILTLIFIPFLSRKLYWKKIFPFVAFTILLCFAFFWLSFGNHTGWIDSVRLWFQTFEFNAGLYYIIREIGYYVLGYNNIDIIGPSMAIATILGFILIWWKYIQDKSLEGTSAMLYAVTLYFMMSTTIHPWYLALPLVLSVLSGHLYPMVWTYLSFLSYSHYYENRFEENYLFIAIDYLLLLGWMIWEYSKMRKV